LNKKRFPIFFSEKGKGAISPKDFIRRVGDLAKYSSWMDKTMYCHFANALRGTAMADMDTEDSVPITWFIFKDLYKEEFATQSDDKLIIDVLANLTMKTGEST
jgi:hypothetical protein